MSFPCLKGSCACRGCSRRSAFPPCAAGLFSCPKESAQCITPKVRPFLFIVSWDALAPFAASSSRTVIRPLSRFWSCRKWRGGKSFHRHPHFRPLFLLLFRRVVPAYHAAGRGVYSVPLGSIVSWNLSSPLPVIVVLSTIASSFCKRSFLTEGSAAEKVVYVRLPIFPSLL